MCIRDRSYKGGEINGTAVGDYLNLFPIPTADIVLNIKELALKSNSDVEKKLILDVKGPGEIKASDISPVSEIEILNPELVICNLDENTNFHMEMTVGTGKGYVSADMNKPDEPPLGLIPIDSLFLSLIHI